MKIDHYKYLDIAFPMFLENIGIGCRWNNNCGIVTSHGDKEYFYESPWEDEGIPFHEGMVLYLLTYFKPYCDEVRETENGWVAPIDWVIDNYKRFKDHIPVVGKDIDPEKVRSIW